MDHTVHFYLCAAEETNLLSDQNLELTADSCARNMYFEKKKLLQKGYITREKTSLAKICCIESHTCVLNVDPPHTIRKSKQKALQNVFPIMILK